jgi:hypothetical protein
MIPLFVRYRKNRDLRIVYLYLYLVVGGRMRQCSGHRSPRRRLQELFIQGYT